MNKNVLHTALALIFLLALAVPVQAAWDNPTGAPPNNNADEPLNVGSDDQIKNGGLVVNAFSALLNSFFGGNIRLSAGNYINFGSVDGSSGYGLRDSSGTIQFKNSGGSWSNLGSGTGSVTISSSNNTITGGGTSNNFNLNINTTNVQSRVSSTACSGPNLSIKTINADGTVTCETDDVGTSGGGGDITDVLAGTGLSGGGSTGSVTLSANTGYLQRRVSSTCAAGSSIRAINSDGTVTCETDDTGSGGIGAEVDTLDSVTDRDPLTTNGISIGSALSTGAIRADGGFQVDGQQVVDADGTWHRSYGTGGWYSQTYGGGWHMTDTTWLRAYNGKNVYTSGQVRGDGGLCIGTDCRTSWPSGGGGSGDITGVIAGSGLSGGGLSGDVTLSVNTSAIQNRVTGACSGVNQSIKTIASDGSVTCETDDVGGGGIGGSGTAGRIPRFTGATTLGDSSITDDGSTATHNGAARFVNDTWFPYTNGANYLRGTMYFNSTLYDENNTTYYLDPASNSTFNQLFANGVNASGDSFFGGNTIFGNSTSHGPATFYDPPRLAARGTNWGTGANAIENYNGNFNFVNISPLGLGGAMSFYIFTPGIGALPDALTLNVLGRVNANAYYYSSDKSLKKNVEPLEDALDKVLDLEGVSFDWKESGRKDIGFIAQDVEEVVPEIVSTNKDGLKTLEYGNITALLVEAIKDQQEQIEELKAEIEALKKQR